MGEDFISKENTHGVYTSRWLWGKCVSYVTEGRFAVILMLDGNSQLFTAFIHAENASSFMTPPVLSLINHLIVVFWNLWT